ncbi:MAG: Maf family protein, partial [Gammaproteobacteria bacterium]
MPRPQLYLASTSPRRGELLAQIGVCIEVVPQNVPENRLDGESPELYVQRLALEKACFGLKNMGSKVSLPVLGADTAVVVDNTVLGKPKDKADAVAMLQLLSARSHRVLSAVAVVGRDNLGQDRETVRVSESIVRFSPISVKECE